MVRVIKFIQDKEVFYTYYCSTDYGKNMYHWKLKCQDTHNIVSAYKENKTLRCVSVNEEITIIDTDTPVLEALFKPY